MASLFIGIEIENISYKNINIEKLYLKYNKKLNISASKISILDKDSKSIAQMKADFTLNYLNNVFTIDVEQFELAGTDLEVQGTIFLDLDTIDLENRSSAIVENLELQFDKKVKKVFAKKVFVTFENNQIDLTFEKPFYDTVDMTNSKVSYLLNTNTLKLYLKTNSLFNDSLKNILSQYNINIPITQHSGINQLSTNISIPFSQGNFFIETDVKSKDTIIESYGHKFDVTNLLLHYDINENILKGNFYLNNYKYKDINFTNSQIGYRVLFDETITTNIFTEAMNLKYDDIDLKLNSLNANFEDLNMSLKGNITDSNETDSINLKFTNKTDFDSNTSSGVVKINSLKYDNLLDVSHKNISYDMNFEQNTSIIVPELELYYFKDKNNNSHILKINNPNRLIDAFTFIDHDSKKKGTIEVHSTDLNDTIIAIDNVNLDINSSYFQSFINTKERFELPIFPKLEISYNNSILNYNSYTIDFENLRLRTDKNDLKFKMIKDDTKIIATIQNGIIESHAINATDKYVNAFLNKEFLKGGYLNLNIYGEDINFLMGDIDLHKTTIKNVTIINSLTTFVNTTPAIINPLLALPTLYRMSETGFDTNGYYLEDGSGSFHYSLPLRQLDLFDLFTNGTMSNFIINSHVNFKTREIQANADISFLKDFTNTINYIPVLGYLFLGDNGEIHTTVDISGTLDNPELETHTVKEGTQGVTNFLQRILTLPLQPFKSN